MSGQLFPFTLHCDRDRGLSPYEYRKAFMTAKPERLTWYGYDVVVESPIRVTFVVFDMLDNFHGGVGKEIHRFGVDVEDSLTRRDVVRRATSVAAERRRKEVEREEDRIVATYVQELLAQTEQTTGAEP